MRPAPILHRRTSTTAAPMRFQAPLAALLTIWLVGTIYVLMRFDEPVPDSIAAERSMPSSDAKAKLPSSDASSALENSISGLPGPPASAPAAAAEAARMAPTTAMDATDPPAEATVEDANMDASPHQSVHEPPEEREPGRQPSIASAARARVVAEASRQADEAAVAADDRHRAPLRNATLHAALQGAAVQLLTGQSECDIQTYRTRHAARASSVYAGEEPQLASARHGAPLAFDADSSTSFHSTCGIPAFPVWLSYRFAEATTVSSLRLTSDAPADYPRTWEFQGRSDVHAPFTTLLRVAGDPGIVCSTRLHAFRCDTPCTRTYEVRAPSEYLEYRLLIREVTNHRRHDRNCVQLVGVGFVGPCASSSLLLHLDASALTAPLDSLVSEWRDQSGHGHHARRRVVDGGPTAAEGGGGGPRVRSLPSAQIDVDDASRAVGVEDDGGSPRLVREARSGQQALRWDYEAGGGLLEAAGLSVAATDSISVFVVAAMRTTGWPARGSKVKPIFCLGDPAFWCVRPPWALRHTL